MDAIYRELPCQQKVGDIFLRQLQGIVNGDETGAMEVVSGLFFHFDLSQSALA